MRVLHLYRQYFPDTFGGIEQVIYQIACGTAEYEIETEVFTLSRENAVRTIQINNHSVHRSRLDFQIESTGISVSAFRHFAQLSKNVDVIHYHYPWPFMDLLHFVARVKKPTVVTYHSDIIRQNFLLKLYGPLMRSFLDRADRIVATSTNYFETSQVLYRYRDKTTVIPIGIDKSLYPDSSPETIDKWRTLVGGRFFLFVGMLRYYKGLHILLEAVQGTDYPVVIVGSGPIEAELKERARQLGLCNIHFPGALPDEDKIALLQLCYAIAFPSHLRSEAFGISLLEGAMFGKPMISSEIGTGTSFININGETGLVVPRNDPLAFREAMRYLWNNPVAANEMGKLAEQRYWKFFTAKQMVASYVDLYKELLAGAGKNKS